MDADKEVKTPAESNSEQIAVDNRSKDAVSKDDSEDAPKDSDGRIKASPLAKKLAAEKGIDIAQVQGSGDNGRITKKDIDSFVPSKKEAPQQTPAAQPSKSPAGEVSFEDVPVSQMRKIIAKRLAESKFTAPHFYLTISINMDSAVASRARLNEVSPVKISFNDLVLKACAVALKLHPK
jgi:pyruvate dehydrogenase E2 component (dihydrolipoamide acetyltransferase)